MTNAQLAQLMLAVARAVVVELERGIAKEPEPTRSRIPDRPVGQVDELARARARDALRRHGILR